MECKFELLVRFETSHGKKHRNKLTRGICRIHFDKHRATIYKQLQIISSCLQLFQVAKVVENRGEMLIKMFVFSSCLVFVEHEVHLGSDGAEKRKLKL